ncbi:hypothetical protein ACIPI6_32640 [Pseudomonas protegens]|uniref:hypothetical protein n=1 Tax=Pseudomonas protegens TaxID=380021 RepID=UPI00380471CE
MKRALVLAMVFMISGCTATDWINAAGETMKARDSYDKKVMSERLRKANSAAMQKK